MPEQAAATSQKDVLTEAREACQQALGTPPGRQILVYLFRYCGVYVSNLEREPQLMAIREGRRDVAVHLAQLAGFAPFITKKEEG